MKKKSVFETKEFKAQQEYWYKILEETGFDDIEKHDAGFIKPQVFTPQNLKTQYDGGINHYELCQEILRQFKFRNEVDRKIFELYAEGKSHSKIIEEIESTYGKTMDRSAVSYLIDRIKAKYKNG